MVLFCVLFVFLILGFAMPLLPIFAIACTIDKNIHLAGIILTHL